MFEGISNCWAVSTASRQFITLNQTLVAVAIVAIAPENPGFGDPDCRFGIIFQTLHKSLTAPHIK
jgi:hypothetical protein